MTRTLEYVDEALGEAEEAALCYGASCLMLGFSSAGLPIHAVCAITDVLLIITLYRPDPGRWIEWRERREG